MRMPSPASERAALVGVLLALSSFAVACSDDASGSNDVVDASMCLPEFSLDCTPEYQPTFDNIFDNRLGVTCGAASTGGSCHAEAGAMAGLVLATPQGAYTGLLGIDGARQRVIAGDPECSLLIQRIESTDPGFGMPPGRRLSANERCAFVKWVAGGAKQ